MTDVVDGIIIGTASAALAAILLAKFFNFQPFGAGEPKQVQQFSYTARAGQISPQVPWRTARDAAPVAQNTPITEAAYNLQPTNYDTTLGPDQNVPPDELTLPM